MEIPQKIVVALISVVHLIEVNNSTNNRLELTGGLVGLFCKDVLEALGTQYELVYPTDGQNGLMSSNGSWTGILGMTMRGDSDLGCSEFLMTEERQQAVEFSFPYMIQQITFVIRKPEKTLLKNGCLYPFRPSVWVCYLVMWIVMSAVLWVALERRYPPGRIVFKLFGSALRQPFMLGGYLWMAKFLLALVCVCALVMTSAYSGILLSFLTVSTEAETIETFRELSAAVVKGTHKCYVYVGTYTESYLLESQEKHLQLLGKAISRNKWYLANIEEALRVLSSNTAILTGSYRIDIIIHGTHEKRSKYLISEDAIFTALMSIPMNRNFWARKRLNGIIMRFGMTGIFQKYVREYVFKTFLSTPIIVEKIEHNHRISVDDIAGALLILCSGYILSFITLLAEIFITKYNINDI